MCSFSWDYKISHNENENENKKQIAWIQYKET